MELVEERVNIAKALISKQVSPNQMLKYVHLQVSLIYLPKFGLQWVNEETCKICRITHTVPNQSLKLQKQKGS